MGKLLCLSEAKLTELKEKIEQNRKKYLEGSFVEDSQEFGWSVELEVKVELGPLKGLNPGSGADIEIANALLVWSVLRELSPAAATDERIWARLTHVECLEFSRKRWLRETDTEKQVEAIKKHVFASTQTSVRDDNAVSRLWWVAYIANRILPDDQEGALGLILRRADTRSNLIERTRTVSRPALASAILRGMKSIPPIIESESSFRLFMKTMNRLGGGKLFEIMPSSEVDLFVKDCATRALS